jgi:hypothetical protein
MLLLIGAQAGRLRHGPLLNTLDSGGGLPTKETLRQVGGQMGKVLLFVNEPLMKIPTFTYA